jgi:protein-S-isoprenylcysteine O-methyltransferase Ste14
MQHYLAALTIVVMLGMVMIRVILMKRKGIEVVKFGKIDKTDFIFPPFALFYFYLIFAEAFHLPTISRQEYFQSGLISWLGVLFCMAGLGFLLWSIISFGQSFRVGIDQEHPDKLVTRGAFAFSRNPIYVAFATILFAQFLVFPNWILLVYLPAAGWLFHRQILREEDYLKEHYGQEYLEYCNQVRRYL